MTPQELFDLIKEHCGLNERETIECAVDLLNNLRNDPDIYCNKLDDVIEEYSDETFRCPICGRELEVKTEQEHSEYQGSSCIENIHAKYCPEDGYID